MTAQVPTFPVTVLVVEDDAVTRRSLCMAIDSEPALQLKMACDSVQSALAALEAGPCDLLLTDLGLPDGSGLEIIRACAQQYPGCDIMVLTMSSDDENVLACIEAGAAGYVLKNAGHQNIVRALLDLHCGGSPISPLIARKMLTRMRGEAKSAPAVELPAEVQAVQLTKRERAILELIARGDSYAEAAQILSVSVGTVQTHVKSIYTKLSVHSRGEAVYEAQRRGLLQFDSLKAKA
jgi:DNA-binding NarL/FixJ family response regulator